jgi:hypothetical protein
LEQMPRDFVGGLENSQAQQDFQLLRIDSRGLKLGD